MKLTVRLSFLLTTVFMLFSVVPCAAGGTWQTYVNNNSVNDIAVSGDYVWVAGYCGGIIKWNRHTGDYDKFTTVDGLMSNTHNVVESDNIGRVWFAYGSRLEYYDETAFTRVSIPDVNVLTMAVDDENSFWLGTYGDGVIHYNGSTYETYTTEEGLADNEVKSIEIDRNGALWFGTINGVSKFDNGEWTTYTMDDSLAGWYIYDIAEDLSGTLWFATNGGISSYDGEVWQNYSSADKLNTVYAREFAIGPDGKVWVGFAEDWDRYIACFDGVSWTKYKRESAVVGQFTSIDCDDDGNVWVGINRGLLDSPCLFKFDGTVWTSYMTKTEPLGEGFGMLVSDHNGVNWFTTNLGLARYDGNEWELFTSTDIGTSGDVYLLAVDMDNTIWCASKEGPVRYNGTEWKIYGDVGTEYGRINSIFVDKSNIKWFGTEQGLISFDGTTWTKYTAENICVSGSVGILGIDLENKLWLKIQESTGTTHIVSFDGSNWQQHTSESSPNASGLYCFTIDLDNAKWFSLDAVGVVSYDGSEWKTYTSEDGLAMSYVKNIAVDKNNVKWFCDGYGHSVLSNGVTSFDGTTWMNYTTKDGLAADGVNTIAVDHNNVKWFGTYIGGVSSFYDNTWKTYTYDDGLIDGTIWTIAVDSRNVKWFSGFLQGTASSYEDEVISSVSRMDRNMSPFTITGNYPNPFNMSTTISYQVQTDCHAKIVIYDILGGKVAELYNGAVSPGIYKAVWNGMNDYGKAVGSGVYFYSFETNKSMARGKMLLMK